LKRPKEPSRRFGRLAKLFCLEWIEHSKPVLSEAEEPPRPLENASEPNPLKNWHHFASTNHSTIWINESKDELPVGSTP